MMLGDLLQPLSAFFFFKSPSLGKIGAVSLVSTLTLLSLLLLSSLSLYSTFVVCSSSVPRISKDVCSVWVVLTFFSIILWVSVFIKSSRCSRLPDSTVKGSTGKWMATAESSLVKGRVLEPTGSESWLSSSSWQSSVNLVRALGVVSVFILGGTQTPCPPGETSTSQGWPELLDPARPRLISPCLVMSIPGHNNSSIIITILFVLSF